MLKCDSRYENSIAAVNPETINQKNKDSEITDKHSAEEILSANILLLAS